MPMHPAAASKMRNPDTNCEQHVVAVVWFHLVSIIQTVNLYLAYADSSHPKQHQQLKILNHMSPAENPDARHQPKILNHMSPAENPNAHVAS